MSFHGKSHFLGGAVAGTWASHQGWPTVVVTSGAGGDQTPLVSFGLISTDHFPPSLVPMDLQSNLFVQLSWVEKPTAGLCLAWPPLLPSGKDQWLICPTKDMVPLGVCPTIGGSDLHENSPWFHVCLTQWFGHQSISVMFLVLGIYPWGKFPGGVC